MAPLISALVAVIEPDTSAPSAVVTNLTSPLCLKAQPAPTENAARS